MKTLIRVTVPQAGLPSNRIIDAYVIREDGSAVGYNDCNPSDFTLYDVPSGCYEFVEDCCDAPEYPNDNVVRYDAYDGCWMIGNEDLHSVISKFEGKSIKIIEA